MLLKRLILVVISLGVGAVLTAGIVYLIGTTPEEYGTIYFFFTALAIGCAIGIWLDKFMATEILPK